MFLWKKYHYCLRLYSVFLANFNSICLMKKLLNVFGLACACTMMLAACGGGGSSSSVEDNTDDSGTSEEEVSENPAPDNLVSLSISWKDGKVPMTMTFSEEAVTGQIGDSSGKMVVYRGRYQYVRAASANEESALRMLIEYADDNVKKQVLLELALKFTKDGPVAIRGHMTVLNDGSQTIIPSSPGELEPGEPPREEQDNPSGKEWATLPAGTVLSMVPDDASGELISFSCEVESSSGTSSGRMRLNDGTGSSGSSAFLFQKSGTQAYFVTSFVYSESTGSPEAPVVYKQADVQIHLDLKPTDATAEKLPARIEGICSSYTLKISSKNGIAGNGQTYSGRGTFSIQSR
ncbi:hypothetical protein QET93_010600 [Akkermansia sp. N21116]|uniref:hypothetical protein n=1 Tax=Akkermansia sp. N21116 TaxID=3040764 RepID=UPI002AC9ABB4|nr:hypothetical protein [Akkermansia sp. N21116]WPX39981.1 hypothetical protein QET93_010600 [Akkermansia sp. N21116]